MSGATLNADRLNAAFTVNDLQRSIKFYTEALGFEIISKHERDGKLQYAAMKAGNGYIGIGQDDFAKGRDRAKGVGMRIWITTTDDLHMIVSRVKAAGFKVDDEPTKMPWGAMAFAITDPDGFKLSIDNPA